MRQHLFTKDLSYPLARTLSPRTLLLCGLASWHLGGCAAVHLAASKSQLQVQSVMAAPIFPEPPASAAESSYYLDLRNSTDKPGLDAVAVAVRRVLAEHGYREASRPQEAHYVLQAAILLSGREALTADEKEKKLASRDQLTSIVAAGAVGAEDATGGAPLAGGIALAIIGGTLATAVDASVHDVTYTFKTEIQLTEPTDSVADEQTKQTLKQGETGTTIIAFGEPHNRKRARTSVTTTANRANLKWQEAEPFVIESVARAVAGVLPAPVTSPDPLPLPSATVSVPPAGASAPSFVAEAPLPPGPSAEAGNVTPGPRPQEDPTASDLMKAMDFAPAPTVAAPEKKTAPAGRKALGKEKAGKGRGKRGKRRSSKEKRNPQRQERQEHDEPTPAPACAFTGSLLPSLAPPRPAACYPGDAPVRPRKRRGSGRRRPTLPALDRTHKSR